MSHIITIFVQTHIFYPKNSDFWPKVIILYISLSNSKLGEKITTFEPTKFNGNKNLGLYREGLTCISSKI
jgi:hypothetical protein